MPFLALKPASPFHICCCGLRWVVHCLALVIKRGRCTIHESDGCSPVAMQRARCVSVASFPLVVLRSQRCISVLRCAVSLLRCNPGLQPNVSWDPCSSRSATVKGCACFTNVERCDNLLSTAACHANLAVLVTVLSRAPAPR